MGLQCVTGKRPSRWTSHEETGKLEIVNEGRPAEDEIMRGTRKGNGEEMERKRRGKGDHNNQETKAGPFLGKSTERSK